MTREEARKAAEVMLAYADGAEVEIRSRPEFGITPKWKNCVEPTPRFNWHATDYRVKLTKPSIDWSHVAGEFICMAMDADGQPWLYHARPSAGPHAWHLKDSLPADAGIFTSFKPGNCDWKDSLVWRSGYEPKGE